MRSQNSLAGFFMQMTHYQYMSMILHHIVLLLGTEINYEHYINRLDYEKKSLSVLQLEGDSVA